MTTTVFKRMCECLTEISKQNEPVRENNLKLFMSQGYLFLDLTDLQVKHLQRILAAYFTDKYIVYAEPDEHGFTAKFEYLRFK